MSELDGRTIARIRSFITDNLLYTRPDAYIADDERLLDRGIIDSMGVVELVQFLEAEFKIEIKDDDITEANLGSLAAIADFVAQKPRQ
jgi:acyl carrier protein